MPAKNDRAYRLADCRVPIGVHVSHTWVCPVPHKGFVRQVCVYQDDRSFEWVGVEG